MAQNLSTRLGELIKARRLEEAYSQERLAELLGCTQPSVSAWERGEAIPTLKAIVGLARVLGIRMHELAALADGDPEGEVA
jgi:transcriptional regulator with XRE-family HTH domain